MWWYFASISRHQVDTCTCEDGRFDLPQWRQRGWFVQQPDVETREFCLDDLYTSMLCVSHVFIGQFPRAVI